ncbi:PEP-CTERM sorting domain-containing protein [Algisphaera agarilytica]|uniref:Cytoskeletal protein CcmA (Bactofilin family) n=1 Tax=Algisphaera agarilytica TaxID=1385975 RepID=A0A7X0HBU8_9BACT|nr:PEP-CTERM sorting domain-containing protein [Algisphaera agarilytica]MBB6431559.1 cytoskeletal protein CcmA (bactofilin family) [Algisphaera agarilytica]
MSVLSIVFRASAVACALSLSFSSIGQTFTLDLDGVSLYAGGTLDLGSFASVEGGAVVAVGDVTGSLDVDSIYGEGALTSDGFDNSRGEIFFNGSISGVGGPGSVLDGPVTSATGSITIGGSTTVNGDVSAGGNFSQTFSFGVINGNVAAGGDVAVDGTVNGNVTHGGTLTLGTFADVTGTTAPGGPVTPTPFAAPDLAPSSGLSAGIVDINLTTFEDITLAPGTYGSLNFDSGNTVSLSAGTYVFADIVSSFNLNELAFDTSGGEIFINIDSMDTTLDLIQSINGVDLFTGLMPDPALAELITLEAEGSLTLNSDFYGTVLVPDGDLELGTFSELTGRALVGGDVTLGNSTAILAVPEPSSALLVLGALGVVARRRARR